MFVRAGINADPVAAQTRQAGLDGMTVDDHLFVAALAGEKRLPDPEQIVLVLPAQPHSRLDPGMDEEIIAQRPRVRQFGEPIDDVAVQRGLELREN